MQKQKKSQQTNAQARLANNTHKSIFSTVTGGGTQKKARHRRVSALRATPVRERARRALNAAFHLEAEGDGFTTKGQAAQRHN